MISLVTLMVAGYDASDIYSCPGNNKLGECICDKTPNDSGCKFKGEVKSLREYARERLTAAESEKNSSCVPVHTG